MHSKRLTPTERATTPVEIDQAALRMFIEFVDQGVDAWTKAGKLLVQIVEKNQNAYAIILKECPRMSISLLLTFERIGRNELHPRLVLDSSIGAKNLLSLPFALQTKYYKEPLQVVVSLGRNNSPVVQTKFYHQLNKDEAKRVFSFGVLRSVEEQAAMIPKKNGLSRGNAGHRSEEVSKFTSIGCFKLSLDEKGRPIVTKTDSASVPTVIEVKTTPEGGIGSNVFEILVDKNLVKEPDLQEDGKPGESPLNAAVENQVAELVKRRSEIVAKLKNAAIADKAKFKTRIREINLKIETLSEI